MTETQQKPSFFRFFNKRLLGLMRAKTSGLDFNAYNIAQMGFDLLHHYDEFDEYTYPLPRFFDTPESIILVQIEKTQKEKDPTRLVKITRIYRIIEKHPETNQDVESNQAVPLYFGTCSTTKKFCEILYDTVIIKDLPMSEEMKKQIELQEKEEEEMEVVNDNV